MPDLLLAHPNSLWGPICCLYLRLAPVNHCTQIVSVMWPEILKLVFMGSLFHGWHDPTLSQDTCCNRHISLRTIWQELSALKIAKFTNTSTNIKFLDESFKNNSHTNTGERYLNLDLFICYHKAWMSPWAEISILPKSQKLRGQFHQNTWSCLDHKNIIFGFYEPIIAILNHQIQEVKLISQINRSSSTRSI